MEDTTVVPATVIEEVELNSAIPKSNGPPLINTDPVN